MSTRPTVRALKDLQVGFPELDVPLESINHPLLVDAQQVSERVGSGGGKRVVSIADRVWFKVKTEDFRGAVGKASTDPEYGPGTDADLPSEAWWLVAAGHRKGDTAAQDFYDRLKAECERAAKNLHQDVSSKHLLPGKDDWMRWKLESTALAVLALTNLVREAIARSAQTGAVWECTVEQFQVQALLRQEDGESYLALTATGFWDHKVVAIILNAVPGVAASDWQIEPKGVNGIQPESGQVVYSTMLEPEQLSAVLEAVDGHYL